MQCSKPCHHEEVELCKGSVAHGHLQGSGLWNSSLEPHIVFQKPLNTRVCHKGSWYAQRKNGFRWVFLQRGSWWGRYSQPTLASWRTKYEEEDALGAF